MPSVFYPRFEVCRIAADGERIALPAETVSVYNVTAASSLGTLVSDADSMIDSGSVTADIFDVIEISHATYPLTCRFTLAETEDEAYTLAENHIAIYIAENLYVDTTESQSARLYLIDLDNPDVAPQYLADLKPGVTTEIPYQTSVAKNVRLAMVSQDILGQYKTNDVTQSAQTFDITIPVSTGGYQPLDATLTALAGANWAANSLAVGSGADTVAQVTFAANTFPARASTGNLVAKTITDFGLSLIDDADASAARTTLGLVIGTNVQAYDADLTTWAGLTPGTGVATALAVNIGTAGAFVVNGGALGTPSSGTLTNCTFPTLNQNTSGSAATLTTTRTIWGQNFNGSANVSGTLALGVSDLTLTGSIGATGARATKVWTAALESTAMPTVGGTSLSSTFSAIAGSASIVTVGTITSGTWNGTDIAVADGGTGRSTSTTAYGLIAAGTTATGAHQTLAAGATTEMLVGGGAAALPVWTTATGSGSPVRATSPTFLTSMALGSDIVGAGTRFVMADAGANVYSVRGQDSTHNLQVNWRYNATAASAYGEIVTWGYSNPLKMDMSVLQIGSNNAMNVKIGGTANRGTTEGTNQLVLFNGTAPVGTLTNGASFYAASGEMRVMDSAGNSTLLSPHDKDGNWIHDEINYKGRRLRVDMERMVKALDKLLGGGFVEEFLTAK